MDLGRFFRSGDMYHQLSMGETTGKVCVPERGTGYMCVRTTGDNGRCADAAQRSCRFHPHTRPLLQSNPASRESSEYSVWWLLEVTTSSALGSFIDDVRLPRGVDESGSCGDHIFVFCSRSASPSDVRFSEFSASRTSYFRLRCVRPTRRIF